MVWTRAGAKRHTQTDEEFNEEILYKDVDNVRGTTRDGKAHRISNRGKPLPPQRPKEWRGLEPTGNYGHARERLPSRICGLVYSTRRLACSLSLYLKGNFPESWMGQ